MDRIFVDIANYIIKNPECRKRKAYEIYNSFFAMRPYTPGTLEEVKLILEYINRIKDIPNNLLLDAKRGDRTA